MDRLVMAVSAGLLAGTVQFGPEDKAIGWGNTNAADKAVPPMKREHPVTNPKSVKPPFGPSEPLGRDVRNICKPDPSQRNT